MPAFALGSKCGARGRNGSARPAVALDETPGGRGTGFFVAPDTLITNAHVVEGNSYVTIRLSNGEAITGRVMQRSDDLDLAAIRTNDTRPGQATLPLASSREARTTTRSPRRPGSATP